MFTRKHSAMVAVYLMALPFIAPADLFGQGAVVFNNRVPGLVDARLFLPDGVTGVGVGFTAQLFGGPAGTHIGQLTALTPTTTFRTGIAAGYVNPVDVTVPGVAPGSQATLVMRVFMGADYWSSSIRGETAPITITLGGGLFPPANLIGLQPFSYIPEPAVSTIALVGIIALSLVRFQFGHRRTRSSSRPDL